jgi:peptide/nickel transport system substrate-binding protein
MGTQEHADGNPGFDTDLPWVSASADIESEEWERALKVRRALHIAIDRQSIVDTILSGEGKAEVLWGWENNMHRLPDRMQAWEFNPELAKQLLAEAGYKDGFDITITPDIRNVPGEVEACDAVATMWENIGINVTISHVPYSVIGPQITAREYNQANCHGTAGRADPRELIHTFSSRGGFTAGFHHPIMDAYLTEALETVDPEAAYIPMIKAAEFLFDNAAESGLYSVNILWPLSANIDGWLEHLQYGDRRALTSLEWTPHRQ